MRSTSLLLIACVAVTSASAQPTLKYLNALNQASEGENIPGRVIAGPMLDRAGTRMVFTQDNGTYFTIKDKNGVWKKPVKIPTATANQVVAGFSGDRVYLWGNGLFYTDYHRNGVWSKPLKAFGMAELCSHDSKQFIRQENGELIAMSSDNKLIVYSAYPTPDSPKPVLYYSIRNNSAKVWSYTDCGEVASFSSEHQTRPVLLQDDKTLLYVARSEKWTSPTSSVTVEQQFFTQRQEDGSWSLPQPTGEEKHFYTWANTRTDTAYFRTTSGRIGYAIDPAGVITKQDVQILAQRDVPPPVVREAKPVANEKPVPKIAGHYYALLIGVSDYDHDRLDIAMPLEDVQAIKSVLAASYSFEEKHITVLANPTRQAIFKELFRLRTAIGEHDNLLIFYAGHGFWDARVEQGYWLPSNSSPDEPSNWLSNSDLREQIRAINTAHTLLISDACFSGGIFRTRSANEIRSAPVEVAALYRLPSRRAITSGALSTVPDQSVFTHYLVKRLSENEEKYLSSQSLFNSLRMAVINNSLAVPQEGVISEAGDEGGDFIFIRR